MKYTVENDFGCVRRDSITDSTEINGTLVQQMDKAGVRYTRATLDWGFTFTEPCYLLHAFTKDNLPITIFVFPQQEVDSWEEEYYYFPGMTEKDALTLNWNEVYWHVYRNSWKYWYSFTYKRPRSWSWA